jgi:S-formylglutathione hydrolase
MGDISLVSKNVCFGGEQRIYKHDSGETRGPMKFGAFVPPQATKQKVPVLYYLAGLTCNEETFAIKAHAQQTAAELGIMLISPDTSPREPRIAGDADHWDFGVGAGFYVDATQAPWSTNYRMYSYITRELRETVDAQLPALPGATGIFGHSMGGHGALVMALRNVLGARRPSATISAAINKPGATTMPRSW